MRSLVRALVGFMSALVLLGAFSVPSHFVAYAAECSGSGIKTTDQEAGFDRILIDGIIFANITDDDVDGNCTSAEACKLAGQCTLNQILQVFVNVTILILGVSGSLVLLMFVYGGFLWTTSLGQPDRIEKGKETVINATIGFVIIIMSYSLINFLISALAGDEQSQTIQETIEEAQQ
ncbi:MAG: pilin [Patescibacteria group bacterium]